MFIKDCVTSILSTEIFQFLSWYRMYGMQSIFFVSDCGFPCVNGYPNGDCTGCVCNDPWIGDNCDSKCNAFYNHSNK